MIVDATIINAPSLIKNTDKLHNPEMQQIRKGKQGYFGMKAHIGIDSKMKMIHSVAVTSANAHDSQIMEDLLHGEDIGVWGHSAYAGQTPVICEHVQNTCDFIQKKGNCRYWLFAQ